MKHPIQAWVEDPMWDRIDDLRRQRRPIPTVADLVRELLDLGLDAHAAKMRKKERAAAEVR